MQIVTGQVARKDNFWPRNVEIEEIWHKITSDQHILLVAPRRVGKTSIMQHLADNPKPDHIVLYLDVEAANSENEFWKKLFNRLKEEDFTNSIQQKASRLFNKITRINITEVSTKGVKFGDSSEVSYIDAFKDILSELDTDKKLVIMIDEFAQSIENINKYENTQSAQSLLQSHRALRQDTSLLKKVVLIYAGSIGLESVANKINNISAINDLASIKVPPLQAEDANRFILALAKDNNINIAENEICYLLDKIEWLIPFYIQLAMDELRKARVNITTNHIDQSLVALLDNRSYFEHWHSRLKTLGDKEYQLARAILNQVAEKNSINLLNIINLGNKYHLTEDQAHEIKNTLVYDGYINNHGDIKTYQFNSPILKAWWSKNVAN